MVKSLRFESAELPCRNRSDGIGGAVGDEIYSQLGKSAAIDFGKLDLQQNLLCAYGAEGKNIDYLRRISAGQFSGALGNILGGNVAGENDGRTRGSYGNLLVGKYPALFVGASADIYIDAQIETARALEFVPD